MRPRGFGVTRCETLKVRPAELTAGMLRGFLRDLPDEAHVEVDVQESDRPGELTVVTIEVEYEVSTPAEEG